MPKAEPASKSPAGVAPRATACRLVHSLLTGNGAVQAELDSALGRRTLSEPDKALCTELVYGSLRWYLRLSWYADRLLRAPENLPPDMRTLLVVALYELFFTRVPAYATVNTYVSLARKRYGPVLARVANGVLRSGKAGIFFDDAQYESIIEPMARLACQYALPPWIASLWAQEYGPEAARPLLEASLEAPPVGLRLAPHQEGLFAALAPLAIDQTALSPPCREEGRTLAFAGALPAQAVEALAGGKATRQAAASQDVLMALRPGLWPGPVWDACAGRGGKTLALLEMGVPVTLASDIATGRLKGLATALVPFGGRAPTVAKLAADTVTINDIQEYCKGTGPAGDQSGFGTILVDAPCSGLGTLARRPEIRLRRTPEDVATLAGLQGRILRNLAGLLRQGGLLVYITCTVHPAENQEQVQSFLVSQPHFVLEQSFQTPFASPLREFFFAAVFRKTAQEI